MIKNIFVPKLGRIQENFERLNFLKQQFNRITKSKESLKFVKLAIPPSFFTQTPEQVKVSRIRYKQILTKDLFEKITKQTIDYCAVNFLNNSVINFNTEIQFFLLKAVIKELLRLETSKELDTDLRNLQGHYVESVEGSIKILLVSLLPIPLKMKLWFLPKKRKFLHQADKILDSIYKLSKSSQDNYVQDLVKLGLNKDDIKNDISTILINSVTLSHSINILFLILAKYPQFQQKFLEDKTYAALCYRESLRMYPPIGIISVEFSKKSSCPFHNIKEKISIDLFKAQNDPKYWKDPFDFNPERHLDQKESFNKAYYPFGLGERECIGKAFSFHVTIELLRNLFKLYKIELVNKDRILLHRVGPFFQLHDNALPVKIMYK